MTVAFNQLTFQNNNGIDVTLTVQAKGVTFVNQQVIASGATANFNPGVTDCPSVVLGVTSDGDPGEIENETFSVDTPLSLRAVAVTYVIGDFQATVAASTE